MVSMPIEEYRDKTPICPYCGQRIRTTRDMRLSAGKIFYTCPKCGKVLGVGNTE